MNIYENYLKNAKENGIKFDFSNQEVEDAFDIFKKVVEKDIHKHNGSTSIFTMETDINSAEDVISEYMLMQSKILKPNLLMKIKKILGFKIPTTIFYFKNYASRSYIHILDTFKIVNK